MNDDLHRTEADDKGGGANWPLTDMVREMWRAEMMAAEQEQLAKRLRSEILRLMVDAGVAQDTVDGVKVTVAHTAASLQIDDPKAIPDEFYELAPTLDRARLTARLRSGLPVAGARLAEPGTSIRFTGKK